MTLDSVAAVQLSYNIYMEPLRYIPLETFSVP